MKPYKAYFGIDPATLMMLSKINKGGNTGATALKADDFSDYEPDMSAKPDGIFKQTLNKTIAGAAAPLSFGLSAGLGAYLNSIQQKATDAKMEYDRMKSYYKTASVDPSYMALGGLPGPVPVQAEVGEIIVNSDGTSLPVLAKKKHKNMPSDLETDILPPDAFILSNDKRMRISKKEAEKMVIGNTPAVYLENETGISPKELKMSDLFKKGQTKATPADLMRRLESMYPRTSRDKDVYADQTVDDNTMSRATYLQGIIALNMLKKDDVISQDQLPVEEVTKAALGFFNNTEEPKEEEVPPGDDLVKQQDGESTINKYMKAMKQYGLAHLEGLEDSETAYKNYFLKANVGNAIGTGAQIAFTGMQDSYVAAPQLQAPTMSEFKGLSQSQIESQLTRLGQNTRNVANAMQYSGASPGQVAGAVAGTTANVIGSQSDMMFRNNSTNASLLRKYYETSRLTRDKQEMYNVKAENETREGSNRKLGAIGNLIGSGINTYVQNQAQETKIMNDLNMAKKTAIANNDVQALRTALQMEAYEKMNNKGTVINNVTNAPGTTVTQPGPGISPNQVPVAPPPYENWKPPTGLQPPRDFVIPPIPPIGVPRGVGPDGTFNPPAGTAPPAGTPQQVSPDGTITVDPRLKPPSGFVIPPIPPIGVPRGVGPDGTFNPPVVTPPADVTQPPATAPAETPPAGTEVDNNDMIVKPPSKEEETPDPRVPKERMRTEEDLDIDTSKEGEVILDRGTKESRGDYRHRKKLIKKIEKDLKEAKKKYNDECTNNPDTFDCNTMSRYIKDSERELKIFGSPVQQAREQLALEKKKLREYLAEHPDCANGSCTETAQMKDTIERLRKTILSHLK